MSALCVLHVADAWDGGGAEVVFRETVRASQRFAAAVHVYTAEREPGPLGYVFSLVHARRLLRILRRLRPDVVHFHNYYHRLSPSVLWAIRAYRRSGGAVRVVFTAHDYHLACPNSGYQYFVGGSRHNVPVDERPVRLLRRYDHRSLAHAAMKIAQFGLAYRVLRLQREFDVVLCPSRFMRRALAGRGLRAPRVLLRNPLPKLDARPAARSRRRDDGTIRLAFAGRLSPEKGILEFLETLEGLPESVVLDVFGDGPVRERLLQERATRGLEHRVRLRGRFAPERLWRELASADCLVMPSECYENAPLVLIEAASIGLPTLGTPLGGIEELTAETTVSATCDMRDADAVARALATLLAAEEPNRVREPRAFRTDEWAVRLSRIYAGEQQGALS